ncbi:MAG: UbiA family prenyltransferase, partial [Candidatus Kapaibacterium sp.]
DRNHVTKKNRPAASGRIKILTCLKLIPILLIMGYGLSLFMPNNNFLYILIAYTIITVYYSFKLKKIYLLDMITLSLLYTTRVVSGGIASDTFLSPWLFSFTMFMFISLGAMKRYTELKGLIKLNKTKPGGRDYHVEDIPLINTIGISAAFVSAVIFTLYIDSPNVVRLYNNPLFLYVITPVILYWLLRMWFIAHRGMMDEDPIVFMVKDKVSYITFAIISLISIMAAI